MTRPSRRLMTVLATAVAIGLGAVVVSVQPAGAHGAGRLEATNYESRILSVKPAARGLDVRLVDLGKQIEISNDTNAGIEVITDGRARIDIPAGTVLRVHEHTIHVHEDDPTPEAVRRDPGAEHLIRAWAIELRQGGTTITVEGELRWVPGPSPWPWLALAAAVFAGVVLTTWRARVRRGALAIALATLGGAQLVHLLGAWGATTSSPGSRLVAGVYSLGGIALVIAALVTLSERDVTTAAPLALLAGLALALAGGLADVMTLARSQLPFTLPAWVDRLSVALTLGIGAAVAIAGARSLRQPTPPQSPTSPADADDRTLDALRSRSQPSDLR